jgi:hypothetical protein
MSFESELRDALRRKSAPADLTPRIMAAIGAPVSRRPDRRRPVGAIAAAILIFVIGGWTVHRVEQQREGERAKAQLMLALRITSQKLHETQQHLQR